MSVSRNQRIIAERLLGESAKALAERYGVTRRHIDAILARSGAPLSCVPDETLTFILRGFLAGVPLPRVGKGCALSTVDVSDTLTWCGLIPMAALVNGETPAAEAGAGDAAFVRAFDRHSVGIAALIESRQ